MDYNKLVAIDKEHIWHPYTSMINPLEVYPVKSTQGVYIELLSGEKLIDGMSSWWCAVHGYNNPELINAAKEQLDKFPHVMFGGLTHEPIVKLTEQLLKIVPQMLDRFFFCDSGSVSVEVAIKMALQYNYAKGNICKTKIATILGGYHGDTWHAMSVCDPQGGMHSLYNGRLPIQLFCERPSVAFRDLWDERCTDSLKELFETHHNDMAAFILEPIVQGAGGMYFYHPNYLVELRKLCDKYDVLLIADEIATGFFRTGKMFACEWSGITPDIMCIGKALSGGLMSFAATIASSHVADTISSTAPHSFMHGPTFMGNPLAAAIACKSVEMLCDSTLEMRISQIETILNRELSKVVTMQHVSDVRVLGAIGVVEMKESVDMQTIQRLFVEEGVWIRPFGRLIYIMPQYVITDEQLTHLCHSMVNVIKTIKNE